MMRVSRILDLCGDVKITGCPYNGNQYFLLSEQVTGSFTTTDFYRPTLHKIMKGIGRVKPFSVKFLVYNI